ncbi:NAD-dependent epimerase/dehydratase family protein [Streptosporangium saharense]|uniref:Nucleoside-diphosphate-sugar epimerase n=1 Tax=Streptosporangium saharense TaxID=1706840 RepID=A0A7W7VQS2_9ACTN|nr:NAD-dependent epimerase/dehydratase family protein [Streptosporangium saharense]MBB4919018.1 nucleoside-diphosphate-sugar epimerase [Streptosporangium saharense]
MTSRHVLVTGGAGFIGTHLCAALLNRGDRVTALDNLSAGRLTALDDLLKNDSFTFLKQDVIDPIDCGRVDAVVHMATPVGPDVVQQRPIATMHAGSIGTFNVLELAQRDDARFLLVSTSEIYGDPLVHPQSEDYRGNVSSTEPLSCYDEAKRFSEAAAFAYQRQYGLDIGIVRPFNVYGGGMYDSDRRVVPAFIRSAMAGQTLTLHGGGTQTRSLCYIDDFVGGMIAMLDSDQSGPINLGSDQEVTIRELAELVVEVVGSGDVEIVPGRAQDSLMRCPDISRARELLGWTPTVPLRAGIERTVAWARTAQAG